MMKIKSLILLNALLVLTGCSGNRLHYFSGHSIFINGNDVYVVGSGCEGTSMSDRPLLWVNGEQSTVGEIGNFNKATSVFVSDDDIYVTMNTENGAFLWKNGILQSLSGSDNFGEANSVCVHNGGVYVGGQYQGAPVIWKDGKCEMLGFSGCVKKVAIHNGNIYAIGYIGDSFSGTPCMWINGEKTELSVLMGEANDIVFHGNDVYIAGECQRRAALWKNIQLVMCEGQKSCAYAVAVDRDDVYLGGNGFDASGRPIALLWKNGDSRRILEMRDDIYSLHIHDNKLYIVGSCKDALPMIVRDLTCF